VEITSEMPADKENTTSF